MNIIGDNFEFVTSESGVPEYIEKIILENRSKEYLDKLYKEAGIDLGESVANGELTECGNDYCYNFKLHPDMPEIEMVPLNYILNVQNVYITEQDKFKYAKYALDFAEELIFEVEKDKIG